MHPTVSNIMDLRLIEIEVYSYCNRKCKFCPNHLIPFRQDKLNAEVLDFDVYTSFLQQLKDYTGVISFSRYNEPLAFKELTQKYVDKVREIVGCKVVANTNGDFLDEETIEIFDELTVMDYGERGIQYWDNKFSKLKCELYKFTGEFSYYKTPKGKDILLFYKFKQNATVEDRGGIIATSNLKKKNDWAPRERPCYEPKYFLGIDYNGEVMVCCNMQSDFHDGMSIGNIYKNTLEEILLSEKRLSIIERMSQDDPSKYLSPCYKCQKDPGRYTRDNPGIDYKGERK